MASNRVFLIVSLTAFNFVSVAGFFITNAEKELLYFSGFDQQQGLLEVEALCKTIGASLVDRADDITPLINDLDPEGTIGVWLNRVDALWCGSDATCCGNYAVRSKRIWRGDNLRVEQRKCNVAGYTLCKIGSEVSKALATLYDLQFESQALSEFADRRDGYLAEVERLHSDHDTSAASAEAILMQLASSLQPPKLAVQESYGRIDHASQDVEEIEAQFVQDMDKTQENVTSKIIDYTDAGIPAEDEFLSSFTKLDAAMTSTNESADQAAFAVNVAYANLEEGVTESDAQLLNHLSEAQSEYSKLEEVTGNLGSKLDREDQIAKIQKHSIDLMTKVEEEIDERVMERSPFERWAHGMNADVETLENKLAAVIESLPSILTVPDLSDYAAMAKAALTNSNADKRANLSFKTASYVLMSLLTVVVIANTILIWKWKGPEDPMFERMNDDDL